MKAGEPYYCTTRANLAFVLLVVDGTSGLALILMDFLVFIGCRHAIGFGGALVLSNLRLPGTQVCRFGMGELTTGHTLANTALLIVLAGIANGRGLG